METCARFPAIHFDFEVRQVQFHSHETKNLENNSDRSQPWEPTQHVVSFTDGSISPPKTGPPGSASSGLIIRIIPEAE